ncbi:serine carboxypeptidase-like 3 [Benincasa hispida]|uniref:serine carboxypeptidase-like 3 n=1 Tax=Benincasa hispida TaxID=102211 RepID=UPI00190113E9|nr:serine carboxypeptidase-like 3 [Benincasa hispida]
MVLAPKALPSQLSIDCQEYKYNLDYYLANDDRVRKVLHIQQGTIKEWERWNVIDDYEYNIRIVVPYHVNLGLKGYRSLVYSEDHDMMVPTEARIESLNYSTIDDWRPWFILVIKYTITYANSMTFATIKGGGHTIEYKPDERSIMFYRWITGEAL